MNNGLPFLLDAIFGKKDLASVSLDELYEVINEFPSFNAGHFLLSKKLKEQNDTEFDKESRRTALYFHNAFWLQTLLDETNNVGKEETPVPFKDVHKEDLLIERLRFESIETEEKFIKESATPVADELDEETEEILNEEIEERPANENIEFQAPEDISIKRVLSFDDLISKYKIDSFQPFNEPSEDLNDKSFSESPAESTEEPVHESFEDSIIETIHETPAEIPIVLNSEPPVELSSEPLQIPFADPEYGQLETFEEIVNEYGIFEEIIIRKSDLDKEAFDRPLDIVPEFTESLPVEIRSGENEIISTETFSEEKESIEENESIIENKINEHLPERTEERDYDAFDRATGIMEEESQLEIQSETFLFPANETDEQKSVAKFNANNAESIVFAPYHVIDYFASQGIKLVLEDQPSDNLGKQLKSFTDWLKVMKKLPAKPQFDKADEKEAERIRHFAEHSIEERDILTESMAEVLAKQGMYENAIALFQKLSLIYPPKSAYFASRIEQLKASQP
jgi:hypothetical protein